MGLFNLTANSSNSDGTTTGQAYQVINGNKCLPMPGNNCFAHGATEPLPMDTLDSMSVHAKMSLTHSIVTHVVKHVNQMSSSTGAGGGGSGISKSNVFLSPALVETYSRLMVYSEIESLGIKGFLNQLLPIVFKQNCWGVLHMLLEMFRIVDHVVSSDHHHYHHVCYLPMVYLLRFFLIKHVVQICVLLVIVVI